jgi:hypothetical protein
MPDRLDYSVRNYELIRPQPSQASAKTKAAELADWIDRDVVPIIDELSRRSDFQSHARWPLERLLRSADAPERRLVESVENRLVDAAGALAAFAKREVIDRALDAADEPRREFGNATCPLQETHPVTAGPTDGAAVAAMCDWAPLAGVQLMEFIAGRPWLDLASSADFFSPVAELNLSNREVYLGPNSSHVQIGKFLPYLNPRFRPLGDFISRALLTRAEYWRDTLQRFSVWCQNAIPSQQRHLDGPLLTATAAMGRLAEDLERLRHALTDGADAKLREASLVLVQAHAAFRPLADFSWLGDAATLAGNAALYRSEIERRENFAMVEQIAAALAEMAPLYRRAEDPDAVLRQACARYELVVVDGPGRREVYWKRNEVGDKWGRQQAPWIFLVALVERLMSGQSAVDAFKIDCSTKDARYRIKRIIPEDLDAHIVSAGTGTYTLNLSPEQVRLLRIEEEERFVPGP